MKDVHYHIGGLFKCCVKHLEEAAETNETKIRCKYCNGPMYKDEFGAWHWDRTRD